MERQRESLQELFEHAPACVALLRGPEHVYEMANAAYLALFNDRPIVGKPIREALPELEGQPFYAMLDEVRRTGTPCMGTEASALVDRTNTGRMEEIFFNFLYQPIRDDPRKTGARPPAR